MSIEIIGAGGIGSWATLALTKMGCKNIKIRDHDKVEIHNTASQLFGENSVGESKVAALTKYILDLTGEAILVSEYEWKPVGVPFIGPIVISAVDSIETRIEIWKQILESPGVELYIDGRMAGDLIRIYSIPLHSGPKDWDPMIEYAKTLVPVKPGPCTARAVVYNTFVCGGFIANLVKKYAKEEEVPFEVSFDLTTLERV